MVGSGLVGGARSILRGGFTPFLIFGQLEVHAEPCLGAGPGLVVVHKDSLQFGSGGLAWVAGRSLGGSLVLSSHKVDGAGGVKGSRAAAVLRCWKRKGQTFGTWKC